MNSIIIKSFVAIIMASLSGCNAFVKRELVPQYQEIRIIHPASPPPLLLKNPSIRAVSAVSLMNELTALADKSVLYYVLSQEAMNEFLNDDVEKLEFAQYERRRAEFYKNAINKFNERARQQNRSVK